jgi:hypothetical protein
MYLQDKHYLNKYYHYLDKHYYFEDQPYLQDQLNLQDPPFKVEHEDSECLICEEESEINHVPTL